MAQSCPACASAHADPCLETNGFEVVRCGGCGLRFVPRDASLVEVDYDDLYASTGEYDGHLRRARRIRAGGAIDRVVGARRVALERLLADPPASLLEIGCGVDVFLELLEKLDPDRRIALHGVDVSSHAIERARTYLDCPLHCGPFDERTFPGQRFDAIITWEVIEHVPDVTAFVRTAFDRLEPGRRAGGTAARYAAILDARLRPTQRATLLGWAVRSGPVGATTAAGP